MARAAIPVTISTRDGVALPAETNGDPANGHYVSNSGKTKLLARNSGAGARTVTFKFYKTVDGKAVADRVESIPAGETHIFGPFPTAEYGTQLLIDAEHAEVKLRAIE